MAKVSGGKVTTGAEAPFFAALALPLPPPESFRFEPFGGIDQIEENLALTSRSMTAGRGMTCESAGKDILWT